MTSVGELEKYINALIEEKKYDEALSYIDDSIEKTLDKKTLALLLYEKGKLTLYMEKYGEAHQLIIDALSLLDDMEDDEFKGEVMFHISGLYMLLGDLTSAEKILQKILKILPEEHHFHLAAIHNLGDLYKRTGNLEKAEKYFLDCYEKSAKYGDNFMAAYSSEDLAEHYAMKKDKENTIKWLQTSLPYSRKAGDNRLVPLITLVLEMLEGKETEYIIKRANEIKSMSTPHAHDIADAFYNYSPLLEKEKAKRLLNEAALIYTEVGNGYMQRKCVERLEELR